MNITLNKVGKRFNREWIFRHFTYTFEAGQQYAITGANGSGKSTLLQVIAGSLTFNEGDIVATKDSKILAPEKLYRQVAIAAPYLELIEEMTAREMLNFHAQFKTLVAPVKEILSIVGLGKSMDKQVRYFSSGMKQRLKLAQAFFSDCPVLLLDEPSTNLDADGAALYHQLVKDYSKNRLVIVSSNDPAEYDFCEKVISIGEYK
jgi:ABC-type multidrug transport system ATPase subunit